MPRSSRQSELALAAPAGRNARNHGRDQPYSAQRPLLRAASILRYYGEHLVGPWTEAPVTVERPGTVGEVHKVQLEPSHLSAVVVAGVRVARSSRGPGRRQR